jgi:Protein tyrosine and serine/threonine kinase
VPADQDLTEDDLETFRNEVTVMRKAFHPNIALFMGACTQAGNIMLVSEVSRAVFLPLCPAGAQRFWVSHTRFRGNFVVVVSR